MSLQFQSQLLGNSKTSGSTVIPFDSEITLQHTATNHYLHSHDHFYPLRYEDGRISSKGQQVLGYANSDLNSVWKIEPLDPAFHPDTFLLSDEEKQKKIRYLRHQSLFRLRHVGTDSYLVTHDVASPLTKTNMEMTTLKGTAAQERYNDTIWKVILFDGDSTEKIKSKKDVVFIINHSFNVALHTFKEKLPDWGFKMQEINGNKKTTEPSNRWSFQTVRHPSIKGILYLLTSS